MSRKGPIVRVLPPGVQCLTVHVDDLQPGDKIEGNYDTVIVEAVGPHTCGEPGCTLRTWDGRIVKGEGKRAKPYTFTVPASQTYNIERGYP